VDLHDDDGAVGHAEMRTGDSVVMMIPDAGRTSNPGPLGNVRWIQERLRLDSPAFVGLG
jgi:uncharacterized glyoxalase superfamily protein PhnB